MFRRKIEAAEKIRIAKACASGKLGQGEAARQVGVDKTTVRDWVRQYQAEGVESFLPRKGNRRYDTSLKEAAVKDYLSGRGSIRMICKIYKIRSIV